MKISVIVCTSNRPAGLDGLLRALLAQQRLPDQLIIVEDRQGPEPCNLLNALREKDVQVEYLRRSPPALTASRNLALAHASGDLLGFFDDDTIPSSDYLRTVEQIFVADTAGRLGGLAPLLEPHDHRPGLGDRLWQLLMQLGGFWSLPNRPCRRVFSQSLCFRFGLLPAAYLPGVVIYRQDALRNLEFDQHLTGYALGEDLDLSFSIPHQWQLYRSTALRIRHCRDPRHRPDRFAMGQMLARNLLYITCKHSGLRLGTLIVLLWQFISLCGAHFLFSILGQTRTHLSWLSGILLGLGPALRNLHNAGPLLPKYPPASASSPCRKHILFILNTIVPGGAETLTLTLLKSLDRQRFSTSLLCLQDSGSLSSQLPSSVEFHHNVSAHKFDLSVLPALVRLILRRRVDLLVSVGNGGDRMFWSSLASLLTARPLIVWCHSYPTSAEPTFERLNRLLRTVAKTFVAVSAPQARALARILHIPTARIKLIENALPNPVDLAAKKPSLRRLAQFRRELNLPAKAFLILTVASLRPVKGHDVLIHAAAEVLAHHKNAYFLLVGQGSQQQTILCQIQRLGIDPKHIVLLGQRLDVPQLLRHCDLFVSPSHRESFGLAVLEAMAASLPVIATDTAGSQALIEHERTGLLVPAGDPQQLAQAIDTLIDDPSRRNALATQAQLFASHPRFATSTMVTDFERVFELLA